MLIIGVYFLLIIKKFTNTHEYHLMSAAAGNTLDYLLESLKRWPSTPIKELVLICNEIELVFAEDDIENEQFYCIYLALLLAQSDLCSARYLWRRIPDKMKESSTELSSLWSIGQSLWKRDYIAAFASMLNYSWSFSYNELLLSAIERKTRNSQLNLFGKSHLSIGINELSAELNMAEAELLSTLSSLGWKFDSIKGLVYPHPIPNEESNTSDGQLHSLDGDVGMIRKLSAFVAHFEKSTLKPGISFVYPVYLHGCMCVCMNV